MLHSLKRSVQKKDFLNHRAFREAVITKARQNVRARRNSLGIQLLHYIDEETGLERANDLAKEIRLVSGKGKVESKIQNPNLVIIFLCQCYTRYSLLLSENEYLNK